MERHKRGPEKPDNNAQQHKHAACVSLPLPSAIRSPFLGADVMHPILPWNVANHSISLIYSLFLANLREYAYCLSRESTTIHSVSRRSSTQPLELAKNLAESICDFQHHRTTFRRCLANARTACATSKEPLLNRIPTSSSNLIVNRESADTASTQLITRLRPRSASTRLVLYELTDFVSKQAGISTLLAAGASNSFAALSGRLVSPICV